MKTEEDYIIKGQLIGIAALMAVAGLVALVVF
jgi:hypothetical protein